MPSNTSCVSTQVTWPQIETMGREKVYIWYQWTFPKLHFQRKIPFAGCLCCRNGAGEEVRNEWFGVRRCYIWNWFHSSGPTDLLWCGWHLYRLVYLAQWSELKLTLEPFYTPVLSRPFLTRATKYPREDGRFLRLFMTRHLLCLSPDPLDNMVPVRSRLGTYSGCSEISQWLLLSTKKYKEINNL